jgi:hypothetical protein
MLKHCSHFQENLIDEKRHFHQVQLLKITKEKTGESTQFNGKFIRHLAKLLGTDAVCSHHIAEKLSDFPIIKNLKIRSRNGCQGNLDDLYEHSHDDVV